MSIIRFWMAALCFLPVVCGTAQTTCSSSTVPDPEDPVSVVLTPGGYGRSWALPFSALSSDQYAEVSTIPFNLIDPIAFRSSHPFDIATPDTVEIDSSEVVVQGHSMVLTGRYIAANDASGSLTTGAVTYAGLQRVHVHEDYYYLIPSSLLFTADETGGEPEDERFAFSADCYYWYNEGSTIPLVTYQVLTQQFGPATYHYKHLSTPYSEGRPAGITGNTTPSFSCFPNPTENRVSIAYLLPYQEDVTISIRNVLGIKHTLLPKRLQEEGAHSIEADLSSYPPGYYVVTLQAGQNIFSQKVLKK